MRDLNGTVGLSLALSPTMNDLDGNPVTGFTPAGVAETCAVDTTPSYTFNSAEAGMITYGGGRARQLNCGARLTGASAASLKSP